MSKPESKAALKIFFHKNESPKRSREEKYDNTVRAHSSSDKSDIISNKSNSSLRDIVFLNMEQKTSELGEPDENDSEVLIVGRLSRRGGETLLKGIFPEKPRKSSRFSKRSRRGTDESLLTESDESEPRVRFDVPKKYSTDDTISETSMTGRSILKRSESRMDKEEKGKTSKR